MRTLPVLLAFSLLGAVPLHAAEDPGTEVEESTGPWEARITALTGEVIVFPEGEEEGVLAEEGTPLEAGDTVRTGADGTAELALEADSVMELGPKSVFAVESLEKESTSFSFSLGRLVAKLRAFVGKRRGLEVRTPTAVAAVRGTEFAIEIDEDGETKVGVFDEGEVGVRSLEDPSIEETVLERKREILLPPPGKRIKVKKRRGRRLLRVKRLKRLKRHRDRMKHLRARRAHLRKTWRRIRAGKRREFRKRWKQRQRQHLKKRLKRMSPEKRQQLKQRFQRKTEKARERHRKGSERAQERRQNMRERGKERHKRGRERRQKRRERGREMRRKGHERRQHRRGGRGGRRR